MGIEIVYLEKPQWKDGPGRLYVPVPRNAEEAGEAVKKLLANGDVKQITIKREDVPAPKP